jgi:hypothetical protein
MDLQTAPLPGDIEYFIDCAVEHEELDACAALALKLYAPRVALMTVIDQEYKHDGPAWMRQRVSKCDQLTDVADDILVRLPIETRAPLVWAGVRRVRQWVTGTANMMARWAQEDMIKGGCGEPYKQARNRAHWRHIDAYTLMPSQRRRLYDDGWIRKYVRQSPDKKNLTRMGVRTRARTIGMGYLSVKDQADKIATMLEAQHESYRRTNERVIRQFAVRELTRSPALTKAHRKVVAKAAATAEQVVGRANLNRWNAGQPVTIAGETIAFDVARSGSSTTMGHGGLILTAVDKDTGRKLANMCLYHEKTPALDQLTALALAVSAGEEAEIMATANLSNVTDLGTKHPLIETHASAKREQPWRPRNIVQERNEAYWQATKQVWLDTLGKIVLGNDWKVLAA